MVRNTYQSNLRPLSTSNQGIIVTIDTGNTLDQIAERLKEHGVIKSDWALEWYVRNNNLRDKLKAGTYLFRPSQSVPEIVDQIAKGKIASNLVTILPGKRLDQIRDGLIKAGFKADSVDKALDAAQYASHPALTDKPEGASLEGYLYPESFQKTADTNPKKIIEQSLDEMQANLTPQIREAFNKQGLTVHEGITLASIIEQEVSNPRDKATVAQVFFKRLKIGMPLQSDVTRIYARLNNNDNYDTYKRKGLPAGPISNVSKESLEAVAYPSQTDWLYFVAGDDGKTYFSKTLEDHKQLVKQHCTKLCN